MSWYSSFKESWVLWTQKNLQRWWDVSKILTFPIGKHSKGWILRIGTESSNTPDVSDSVHLMLLCINKHRTGRVFLLLNQSDLLAFCMSAFVGTLYQLPLPPQDLYSFCEAHAIFLIGMDLLLPFIIIIVIIIISLFIEIYC